MGKESAMNCSSLDPELTAKVLLLASLQRSLAGSDLHHANSTAELHCKPTLAGGEQLRAMHPLLMPSLSVSSQKISAMLTALNGLSLRQSTAHSAVNNNAATIRRTALTAPQLRSTGSSFGWGNRERKMEENWRLQNRSR